MLCGPAADRAHSSPIDNLSYAARRGCLSRYLDEVDVAVSTHARIFWPAARRLPHQDAVVHAFGHHKIAKPTHTVDIAHMHLHPVGGAMTVLTGRVEPEG